MAPCQNKRKYSVIGPVQCNIVKNDLDEDQEIITFANNTNIGRQQTPQMTVSRFRKNFTNKNNGQQPARCKCKILHQSNKTQSMSIEWEDHSAHVKGILVSSWWITCPDMSQQQYTAAKKANVIFGGINKSTVYCQDQEYHLFFSRILYPILSTALQEWKECIQKTITKMNKELKGKTCKE